MGLPHARRPFGVTVLINQAVELDGLYVVGIGAHMAGNDKPAEAFASVPSRAHHLYVLPGCARYPGLAGPAGRIRPNL